MRTRKKGWLVLAVVVALRVARTRGAPAAPRHELAVLGTATIVALVLNLAIFGAFARVPIAVALLAFYTYPAMIAAVAIVSGTERPSPGIVLALLLTLCLARWMLLARRPPSDVWKDLAEIKPRAILVRGLRSDRWANPAVLERLMGRVLVLKAFKPLSAAIAVAAAA